jgi:hypothetical protein
MGVTQITLFRSGNADHSRLTDVRTAHDSPPANDPDIDTYIETISGEIWVSSGTGGGASAFDAHDPRWRKPWRLPAGTPFPDTLRLWNDDNPKGHWTFAAAYDMSLADFKAELAKVAPWEQLVP